MDKHERSILTTVCYGHFLSHVNMMVFPAVLLPMAEKLNLGMADVLGISFWMYFLFGITALPWGMAADRWGAGPFMVVFYLGAGLSALAASLWLDSSDALLVSLAVLGLFSGIYHPTGLGLISKEIQRVSMAMGYNGMFGNLGLAVAPLFAGVLNFLWGPRSVYVSLGIMNLAGILLMKVFPLVRRAKDDTAASDEETNGMLSAFTILLVAMMLGGIAYRGSTVILPAYFELRNEGIFQWLSSVTGLILSANLVATVVTFFIYMTGMVGQYTGGRLAERFDPRHCYLVFHGITVPVAMLMAAAWDVPLVMLAMVYLFFLLGMQPIENTLVARFTPRRFHHSAYGTKFILTFGVGALAVKLVGAIETWVSIEAVFTTMGLISLTMVGVIVLLIHRTREQA